MSQEQEPRIEFNEYNPDENWAEFAARVDAGLRPGSEVPDCPYLGAVANWATDELMAEAGRIFNYGRSRRHRQVLRRLGRIGTL